ncbi:MAG: hypothetical protein AAF624_14070 [Bacteroidota bacterium]
MTLPAMHPGPKTGLLRFGVLPLLLFSLAVAPSIALAQSDDDEIERRRITIRVDGDSIYVERNGETTVVPNTPEGRAELDGLGLDLDRNRVRIEIDEEDFDLGGDDMRVFRMRRGGLDGLEIEREFEFGSPGMALRRFGPSGLATFRFDDDLEWVGADAEAQAEIMTKEMEARNLARQLRSAESGERADLEAQLDALLAELFEMKLIQRRASVERLEEKLAEERAALSQREAARADIIERRKQQLLGEDTLEW